MFRCIHWRSACFPIIRRQELSEGRGSRRRGRFWWDRFGCACCGCCWSCGASWGLSFRLFISITSCAGRSRMRIRISSRGWLASSIWSFIAMGMTWRGMRRREHVSVETAARELRYGFFIRLLCAGRDPQGLKPTDKVACRSAEAAPLSRPSSAKTRARCAQGRLSRALLEVPPSLGFAAWYRPSLLLSTRFVPGTRLMIRLRLCSCG